MLKKIISLICLISMVNTYANESDSLPEVGKPIPEFYLQKVFNHNLKTAKSSDFKGKWLFLDFWFTGCTSCIHAMPKINKFHGQFKQEAVFLLVGANDNRNSGIEEVYEGLKSKKNLAMPYTFDSVMIHNWKINSMPRIIIVSPEGIVKAITDGRDMTEEKLRDLFAGKEVAFYEVDKEQKAFDTRSLDKTNNVNVLYRSGLTRWNGENQLVYDIDPYINNIKDKGTGYQAVMIPLLGLYNLAYIGKFVWISSDSLYDKCSPQPILQMQDTSAFAYDYTTAIGKGLFNYILTMPKQNITRGAIMETMQHDLKNTFNYDVAIENRLVTVWKLIVVSDKLKNRLKSKGREIKEDINITGEFLLQNYPVKSFLSFLTRYIKNNQPPFIDLLV